MNLKDKAQLALREMEKAYHNDMECGVSKLSKKAREDFKEIYPEISMAYSFSITFLKEIVEGKYDT